MSGTPVRVAVQLGSTSARMAAAGSDGEPWLVARTTAPGATVASLLAELAPMPEELVLVHPANWPSSRVASWVRECAGLGGQVRAVPAPLAAAGLGAVAVLDVGRTTAEATRWDAAGRLLAVTSRPVGGADLDAALMQQLRLPRADPTASAEAQRVREALSLLPEVWTRAPEPVRVVADEVRALLARQLAVAIDALHEVVYRTGPARVLLVGGVARTPLLAELLDEAGIAGDVSVAPRPDVAAVLGALKLPGAVGRVPPMRGAAPSSSRALIGPGALGSPSFGHERATEPFVARRLPPPLRRARRPLRTALLFVAAAGVVAGLLGVGALLPSPSATVPAGVLVQYGYRLDVPSGWEHTGGLPARRRTMLTPAGAPEGSDLIASSGVRSATTQVPSPNERGRSCAQSSTRPSWADPRSRTSASPAWPDARSPLTGSRRRSPRSWSGSCSSTVMLSSASAASRRRPGAQRCRRPAPSSSPRCDGSEQASGLPGFRVRTRTRSRWFGPAPSSPLRRWPGSRRLEREQG